MDEENELLIRRESQDDLTNVQFSRPKSRIGQSDSDKEEDSQDSGYEQALSLIGFGRFHLVLLFVCGLANASDAIEILCVSFILPSAECDLRMTTTDKGYLSSMTFVGMMFGGYIWGSISDIAGRKKILILALLFNGFFGICSGLAQSFMMLLVFRFFSGIGVGGSVPIVWSYFAEFIPKQIRGRLLCCLASSWLPGNLMVILFAFLILNQTNIDVTLFGMIFINSWRWFMIACALPSILTAILLLFLPESPKFCLHNGMEMEGRKILKKLYSANNSSKSILDLDKKKKAFDFFEQFKVKLENSNGQDTTLGDERYTSNSPQSNRRLVGYFNKDRLRKNLTDIIKKTASLFKPPHIFKTISILFIMFALCFGYYGLWIWLPELYKRMAQNGGSPCSSSSSTNFTVITNKTASCHIENGVFLSSFYSALSNLPGNLFTIIFIDKMGRNLVTSLSLILSGISVFGIPFIHSENQGVILTTIFGGINVITFNSFGCTTTELYPTNLRSTSLGVQYVAGRTGAILGNVLFGLAVDISCYIPLLTISSLLIISGLMALKLPESNKMDMD